MIPELLRNIFSRRATVMYPREQRKPAEAFRGVLRFERELCVGCGLCWRVCPASAIEASEDDKGPRPVFRLDKCIYCYLCVEVCPRKAIKGGSSRPPTVPNRRELVIK